jgi:glycosyltransferase involved in cell wall biosynthesis
VYWLWRQLTELQCDLVIVRDLRLAVPTILAARHCRKRVILDLGEHYPGMMEILGKTSLAHHVMRNHWLITLLEAASVALADVVWVVVDENRERLLRYNSRMHVVNNYPAGVIDLQGRHPAHRPYSERGDAVRIISFGLMDNIRGLDLAVDALAVAVESLPNLELAFYGDGPFRPVVEERVAALGLQSKVKFFGWTDAAHRSDALLSGDIGIILHRVCDLTNHTLPNKLFDYMSVGLPILATKMVPVCRIMEREKCGLAADETPAAVAQLLRTLVLDAELRRALGANGRRAALMHYRWETEAGIVASDILSCIEVSRHGRHAS